MLQVLYKFHTRALRNIDTYAVNPQMHTDTIRFIIRTLQSPTYFGRFFEHNQGALQE